ncbi:MAG: glycosyltransferase family 2 protein [Candidatus Yanofskybacteria bacterium]|nr:glycosyltransferase family 2 protein [Candidatus Yanofskybacteria bacterium]
MTINLVVLNGEKYVRHFLSSLAEQTYPHDKIQFNILDNGSVDNTKSIIATYNQQLTPVPEQSTVRGTATNNFAKFFAFNFIESSKNLGMWPGQEELLKYTNGEYVVASAVDIILDKNFIKNTVEIMEKDKKIGALQPKIYRFDQQPTTNDPQLTKTIDTLGFKMFKSRRVVNIGHGEEDNDQFNEQKEIFAVEGAVPVFRKEALESCRIPQPTTHPAGSVSADRHSEKGRTSSGAGNLQPTTEIVDHGYFWYGDDLDLAWRMRLFGWKEVFAPNVVAWHDRQTTKTLRKNWLDYFSRVSTRKQIPIKKRRLDWRNTRWTLIKNDYIINILKDMPWIVSREFAVLGYAILFEPKVLKEIPTFFRYLPKMLRKRREIMKRVVVGSKEFRKWIN